MGEVLLGGLLMSFKCYWLTNKRELHASRELSSWMDVLMLLGCNSGDLEDLSVCDLTVKIKSIDICSTLLKIKD